MEKRLPPSLLQSLPSMETSMETNGWPVIKRQCLVERMHLSHKLNHHDIAVSSAVEALRWSVHLNDNTVSPFNSSNASGFSSSASASASSVSSIDKTTSRLRSFSSQHQHQHQRQKAPAKINRHRSNTMNRTRINALQSPSSRLHLPFNARDAQEILTNEILTITTGSMPTFQSFRVNMMGMPSIENVRILRPSDEARQHFKTNTERKQTYRRGETKETTHKYSKIFYDPFAADATMGKRTTVEWVEGETGEVMVDVVNPLLVEMHIQNINVVVEGVPYEGYSQSFTVAPQSRRTVMLGLKPLASGTLTVVGCHVKCLNLSCVHRVDTNGQPLLLSNDATTMSNATKNALATNNLRQRTKITLKTDPVVALVIPALPVLTARDVFSNASPLSKGKGKMATMFSLMEGQVHRHRIYLENVGTVPIHQLRITLRMMVVENKMLPSSTSIPSSSSSFSSKTQRPTPPQRTVDIDVFTSDKDAPGTPAKQRKLRQAHNGHKDGGKGKTDLMEDDLHEVFVWDESTLDNLRGSFPLSPGQIVELALTIDARRGIPSADLIASYAQNVSSKHSRALHVPFALTMEPALDILGIDVQLFGTSIPSALMALALPFSTSSSSIDIVCDSTDADTSLVVLNVENPTSHPFEVTCRVRAPTPSTLTLGSSYESLFVSTFEGNSRQRLVVPVRRSTFKGCTDEKSTLRALDTVLDIYWKSSHGTIGSMSLIGSESRLVLSDQMIKHLLPSDITVHCHLLGTPRGAPTAPSTAPSTASASTASASTAPIHQEQRATNAFSPSAKTPRLKTKQNDSNHFLPPSFMTQSYPSPIPAFQQCPPPRLASEANATKVPAATITKRVGETVTVHVGVTNTTLRPLSFDVRLVPYMEKGGHVVLMDEMENEPTFTSNPGCFVWSGSLCKSVNELPPNDTVSQDIECCMLLPGEYKFAVLCTKKVEGTTGERCWSSHPLIVKMK